MKRSALTWAGLTLLMSFSSATAFAQENTAASASNTASTDAQRDPATSLALAPSATPIATTTKPHHHFHLGEFIDDVTIAPLARLYGALPRPLRNGVHNVLSNLDEPDIAINDVLQLHPARAAGAIVRFAANTTIGVAGVIDVAKHFGIAHHDNDAATTLAYYRIANGPEVHVPIIGVDNLREAAGFAIDFAIDPVGWGRFHNADVVYTSQLVLDAVDERAADDETARVELAQATTANAASAPLQTPDTADTATPSQ